MDPRLLKLLGVKVMAPVVEDGGADQDDEFEAENDDIDEEENDDDDDDEGDEDDEPEGDDEDDDEEDDEGDDEEDDDLGDRAKKRIGGLVKRAKSAEAQVAKLQKDLEEAKKLSGDDGKAILRAAEVSGILPGLMSKDEAKAFAALDQYPKVIASYEDWLDEHGEDDELEMGGKTLSYKQVKRRVKELERELDEIKDEYGGRRKELNKKVREIFQAGLEALKRGETVKKPKGSDDEGKKRKKKKFSDKPKGREAPKHNRGKTKVDDMDVNSTDDLEAYILASRRKK